MGKPIGDYTDDELMAAVEEHGSIAAAGRALGFARNTVGDHVRAIRGGTPRPATKNLFRLSDQEIVDAIAMHGSADAAASALDIPKRTMQTHAARLRSELTPASIERLSRFRPRPLMGLIRTSGNGLLLGDIHLPITKFEIVAAAVRSAIEHGCTDFCIVAGDLFNADALSDYFPKQNDHGLDDEISAGGELLLLLLEVFGVVIVTKGNHDIRLQKALGFRLKFEHTLRMFLPQLDEADSERLQITGRDYAIVDTPEGEWRVCHTRQYSETPLAIPIKIADVNQQHVAGFHRHHYAVGTSRSGKMVVEGGGAFDTDRTEYLKQWSTTHPRWQPGWTLLKEGKPFLPMLAPCPTCG